VDPNHGRREVLYGSLSLKSKKRREKDPKGIQPGLRKEVHQNIIQLEKERSILHHNKLTAMAGYLFEVTMPTANEEHKAKRV
jgi:hypothetical protein